MMSSNKKTINILIGCIFIIISILLWLCSGWILGTEKPCKNNPKCWIRDKGETDGANFWLLNISAVLTFITGIIFFLIGFDQLYLYKLSAKADHTKENMSELGGEDDTKEVKNVVE